MKSLIDSNLIVTPSSSPAKIVQLKYHNILFFDDDMRNINDCKPLGVCCNYVDPKNGLTWELFREGLKKFKDNRSSMPSLRRWFNSISTKT